MGNGEFFENINSIEELRQEYKKLVFKHHPDRGGSHEQMVALNKEYKEFSERLSKNTDKKAVNRTFDDVFIQIINKLVVFDDLEIELCGSWLWIGGNTKIYKKELKELGCSWSAKKLLWYWHVDTKKRRSSGLDIEIIRNMYGSKVIKQVKEKELIKA